MNFKKTFRIIAVVFFTAFIIPSQSNAAAIFPTDSIADSRMAAQIIERVNEIQDMDKSGLTVGEKKELKKELRQMKQKADGLDSKVYLSIGAIIIIILILILLLR